eukprot:SRR837773.10913.p3 GENE.SRR837773.10913~~SRR837773.10913.p3  ORF type:complete len:206 (-),score=61.55 SRR837773.10913:218-769(-)
MAGGSGGGITVRTFQSLWRLAQAHARLMNHHGVQLEDAVAVVLLHKAALQAHVVGVESAGEAEDFAPTLPDLEGEIAPCTLRPAQLNADLHHGMDIPNLSTYIRWEAWVMRYLANAADGPKPLGDVPRAAPEPRSPSQGPGDDPGSAGSLGRGWAAAASQSSPGSGGSAEGAQRGRRLGCRMR